MANAIIEIRMNDIDSKTLDRLRLAVWDTVCGQAGFASRTKNTFTSEAGSQTAVAAMSSGEVQVLCHEIG